MCLVGLEHRLLVSDSSRDGPNPDPSPNPNLDPLEDDRVRGQVDAGLSKAGLAL